MKAIIIMRDRVTYARRSADALTAAGLDVHIVDHGSTWPPATEWLATSGLPVHYRGNHHPRDLWDWDGLSRIVGTARYVVTDPDVVPDEGCPADWPALMGGLLDRRPARAKVGLGLNVDDLPTSYADADSVRRWEAQYWRTPVGRFAFDAWVDTTLAMYPPLIVQPAFALGPALRTGHPYVGRHLTWHEDSANPSAEIRYYREHATPGVSHWVDSDAYTGVAR